MMVWLVTIGGIMNIADLPCPMGMTTNKSSLFSKTNVTAKPCSLHVHCSSPNQQRAHRERISCAWSWSGGGMASWMVVCVIEYMSDARRDAHLIYNGQWLLGWSICYNLNLGLITKARAYKGASQKWSLRVTFHAHGSVGKCEGMNRHTPKWAPILGIRVPMDSWIFRGQL